MAETGGLTRRGALKLGLAGAAGAAGLTGSQVPAAENAGLPGTKKPNILLLLVGEQRFQTVYESAALKAFRAAHLPAQGRLAQSGVSFERHYVASVAGVPSRASLYTGHYPSLHGAANTDGGAKAANDPDMRWLLPGSVPTIGHYLGQAGYRTLWRGKWRATDADLKVPGTDRSITSYDANGITHPEKAALYVAADPLGPFGFSDWVGPEPHGPDPLKTGSSAGQSRLGRDQAISAQVVETLQGLHVSETDTPWFLAASLVNPHDIALWGYFSNLAAERQAAYDFSVPDSVPEEPFDTSLFARTRLEKLDDKPSSQKAFRDAYATFMLPAFASRQYYRLYYRLHADADRHLGAVLAALEATRFRDDTIVIFTSDHGTMLGAHGGMHQKWYTAYDEAVRVPLVISIPGRQPARTVAVPTSHIDIAPTILGLAGINHTAALEAIAGRFTDPLPLVGRDLSPLIRGVAGPDQFSEPIYFMTDDDPSRGAGGGRNFIGIPPHGVAQPNHVESVIAAIDGEIWKYSRYFDHPRYWSAPGTPGAEGVEDVVRKPLPPEGEDDGSPRRVYEERIKTQPAPNEYEMYNVTADPMELENLAGKPEWKERESKMRELLVEQCARKRLVPASGPVPGEDGCRKA